MSDEEIKKPSILQQAAKLKGRLERLEAGTAKKMDAASTRILDKHNEKKGEILADYPAEVQSLLATAAELESEAG